MTALTIVNTKTYYVLCKCYHLKWNCNFYQHFGKSPKGIFLQCYCLFPLKARFLHKMFLHYKIWKRNMFHWQKTCHLGSQILLISNSPCDNSGYFNFNRCWCSNFESYIQMFKILTAWIICITFRKYIMCHRIMWSHIIM